MATLVGTQSEFSSAVKELVELDYDAIEAYEAAINRLDNQYYIEKLIEFKSDHQRHIQEFSELLRKHNEEAPAGPSLAKQWLAKGKVVLANFVGDNAIINAMNSNESDTTTAYERMNARLDKWEDATDIIKQGLADGRRHQKWLDNV